MLNLIRNKKRVKLNKNGKLLSQSNQRVIPSTRRSENHAIAHIPPCAIFRTRHVGSATKSPNIGQVICLGKTTQCGAWRSIGPTTFRPRRSTLARDAFFPISHALSLDKCTPFLHTVLRSPIARTSFFWKIGGSSGLFERLD